MIFLKGKNNTFTPTYPFFYYSIGWYGEKPEMTNYQIERIKAIIDKSKTTNTMVDVVLPITIEKADYYKDGGSIGLIFVDSARKKWKLYLDRGMSSPTKEKIFLGSERPGDKEAILMNKEEYKKIRECLESWLNTNCPNKNEQQRISNEISHATNLPKKEYEVRIILDILKYCK
jgi:hypothetical protein